MQMISVSAGHIFWCVELSGAIDLSCVTFCGGGSQWQTKETVSPKSCGGKDEFMAFLTEVWETQRKGNCLIAKATPAPVTQKMSAWSSLPNLQATPLKSLSPSQFFFPFIWPQGGSYEYCKFFELPESYKFPVSFPSLLVPTPSLYKRRFQFRGNSHTML